ncbi:MAG: hypothetical protein LBD20_06695 [Spirochaetaceae bacterium]|jgi:hypothetical protein|nr:hypothetical protein [Spirochaetaceae bacterium]
MLQKINAGSVFRYIPARLPILAVLIMTGAAAVYAQTSPTSSATGGRFTTDVDNFISTTDWAGVPVENWFSYLNIGNSSGGLAPTGPWEIGFAKKLSKLYIGLSYSGKFWNGESGFGTITEDPLGTFTGPTVDITDPATVTFLTSGSGISASSKNVVSLLFGFENGSALKVKFTEDNGFNRKEGDIIVKKTGEDDRIGFGRVLDGSFTPSVEWGTAKPLEFGKFSIKPKATLDLKVGFNEQEVQVGGETVWANFRQNSLTPTLALDSGANTFWSSNGGSFGIGLADKVSFLYKDEPDGQDAKVGDWKNVLTPYARFTQVLSDSFAVKAALDVPFSIEAGGKLGFYDATVASGGSLDTSGDTTDAGFPRLRIGTQYKFKGGKLALNAGVIVYLPALVYSDATATMEQDSDGNDTTVVEKVESEHSWEWKTKGTLQELKLGMSFKFTDNAMLDLWTNVDLAGGDGTLTDNQITNTLLGWGGIVFSLTF